MFFGDFDKDNAGERRRTRYNAGDDTADAEESIAGTETSPHTSNGTDEDTAVNDLELGKGTGGLGKVGFRDRIACYTWTWFTLNMATGGIANVLFGSKTIPKDVFGTHSDNIQFRTSLNGYVS